MIWLFRSVAALLVYNGIIIYSGIRIFAFIKLYRPALKARIFWIIYIFLPYSFILLAFLRLDRVGILYFLGMYLPPFYIFLFGFIFLFDFFSLVLYFLRRLIKKTDQRLVRMMPASTGAALVLTLLLLVYGSVHARNINTAYYSLTVPGFSSKTGMEKLRIVLVSDLHIGPSVGTKWTSRIIDRINEAKPDIVCMAGDIFDNGLDGLQDPKRTAAELKRITAPMGIYACPGNHDTNRRTRSIDDISRFLSETVIKLLADEVVPVQSPDGKSGIYVAGRRDARPIGMQSSRLSVQELAVSENMVILLDHQPVELPEAALAGVDLVLCGHTHKGQFFPGNLFTRSIFKKAGGTHYGHWQKGNTQAIVSSGAGVWGPSIRIGTNSEIVVIDVQ